jgi:hypothetical protein
MQRRFPASWVPLLAVLLVGPLLSACPDRTGSGEATLEPFHIRPLPDYSPYQERPDPAVKANAPANRQPGWGSLGRAFTAYAAPKFFAPQHPAPKQQPYSSFIAGSQRHFTLFPTGPPQHH